MGIAIQCTTCGARYEVAQKFAGRNAKCSKCGNTIPVPAPKNSRVSSDAGTPTFHKASGDYVVGKPTEQHVCPGCGGALAANAVLCVDCGFDLRSGKRTKRREESRPDGQAAAKPKPGLSPQAQRRIMTLVIVAIVGVLCVVTIWLGWKAYEWYEWDTAYYRIGEILDAEKPSAHALAAETKYLFWYCDQVQERNPKGAGLREMTILGLIPQMPKSTDIEPLLQFPSDSFAYHSVILLARQHTDLDWQIAKSCDVSPNIRSYGADLLIGRLPFLDFDDDARNKMLEPTSIGHKRKHFDGLYAECIEKGDAALCGTFHLKIKLVAREYQDWSRNPGGEPRPPKETEIRAAIVEDALSVVRDNDNWSIRFLGDTWTGPTAQLPEAGIVHPVSAIGKPLSQAGFRWQGGVRGMDPPEVRLAFRVKQLTAYAGPFDTNQLKQWAGSAASTRDNVYLSLEAELLRSDDVSSAPDGGS